MDRLFARNERICASVRLPGQQSEAPALAMVAVGATLVGKIRLAFDDAETHRRGASLSVRDYPSPGIALQRGAEWGRFEFGSTLVMIAAADALARRSNSGHIRPLLAALGQTQALDGHLRHALRIALRNNLHAVDDPAKLADLKDDPVALRHLMSVVLSVNSPFAGSLMLGSLENANLDRSQLVTYLRHIARNAPSEGLGRLVTVMQKQFTADLDFQAELLLAINDGIIQRGLVPEQGVLDWAENLARQLLAANEAVGIHWVAEPAKGVPPSDIPWVVQSRNILVSKPRWENHAHHAHPTVSPWVTQVRASSDGVTGIYYITLSLIHI